MSIELPDEVTADYEVVRSLGVGGQGHTMLARRRADGEQVVLKTLDFVELSSWKDLELLQREMKVLASLSHPAIPKLIAHYPESLDGESPEAFVIVQELVDGVPLDRLLAEEEGAIFDENAARAFLHEMLDILAYLHGLNPPVVHRDIKPSNIMRRPSGQYVLIDFGAATASGVLTGSTTFVGTNGYMPPEQLMGRAEPRSDLFALGATTLELMTGINPSNLAQEDLSFRLDVVDASSDFVNVIRVLTHPSPTRRYMTAVRAKQALENPTTALVLGSESPAGLLLQRRADGVVTIDIPSPSSPMTGLILAVVFALGVTLTIGGVPLLGIVIALVATAVAYRRLPQPGFELDAEEIRLNHQLGPYRRTRRWSLASLAEIWSGPVPTKTGVLFQESNGAQTALRFGKLTPDQHHWLGDVIRNHREGQQ